MIPLARVRRFERRQMIEFIADTLMEYDAGFDPCGYGSAKCYYTCAGISSLFTSTRRLKFICLTVARAQRQYGEDWRQHIGRRIQSK
jgi:hypothetical protein